jgi:hypothetical protein
MVYKVFNATLVGCQIGLKISINVNVIGWKCSVIADCDIAIHVEFDHVVDPGHGSPLIDRFASSLAQSPDSALAIR